MKQDKTNPGSGLRALIDELYAKVSKAASGAAAAIANAAAALAAVVAAESTATAAQATATFTAARLTNLMVALADHVVTANAAPITAVSPNPVQYNAPAFTPTPTGSGKVKIRASMAVIDGTSVAGETVLFNLTKGGVVMTGSAGSFTQLSVSGQASATLVWEDSPGAGVAVTYGIQCANVTTPAHTLSVDTLNAGVEIEETP